jgi:hypothetical protein
MIADYLEVNNKKDKCSVRRNCICHIEIQDKQFVVSAATGSYGV